MLRMSLDTELKKKSLKKESWKRNKGAGGGFQFCYSPESVSIKSKWSYLSSQGKKDVRKSGVCVFCWQIAHVMLHYFLIYSFEMFL